MPQNEYGYGVESRSNVILPPTLQLLTNLQALSLEFCNLVGDASSIGCLKGLKILSFFESRLDEFPREVWELKNLKLLDLRCSYCDLKIGNFVLSGMDQLEVLYMGNYVSWAENSEENNEENSTSITELNSLPSLTTLQLRVSNSMDLLELEESFFERLKRFDVSIDLECSFGEYGIIRNSISQCGDLSLLSHTKLHYLVRKTQYLKLEECEDEGSFIDEGKLNAFHNLETLEIEYMYDLTEISKIPDGSFPKLQELRLNELSALRHLWSGPIQPHSLGNLRVLDIDTCRSIKYLFSSSVAKCLVQLKVLNINCCYMLEGVISYDGGDYAKEIEKIEFPKLNYLGLESLHGLKSFSPERGNEDLEGDCGTVQSLLNQRLAMEIFQGSGQLVMSLITLSLQAILYSGGSKLSAAAVHHIPSSFNKSSFPQDFVFGGSSSAYQYEGAANEGGRGASIWDTFTHKHPEKIMDHSTGDVANDFYHRYEEDIDRLKDIGMDAFRLSISLSRILPRGKISGGINREGIKFYNNVFNKLITQGIKPYVTLFHWDVPQALEDEYEGFLHENIVNDFQDYADLCFKEFGDKVKYWTTINEPIALAVKGYDSGEFAPGRCSSYVGDCPKGNSATEPYIVGHNQLLAHAAAVNLYKHKYQASQKGEIGITLVTNWYKPKTRSAADLRASLTSLDFNLGWYLHPLTYGDYPSTMRKHVGKRLPKFTKRQAQMVKGSMNFLGINYYTTTYVSPQLSVVNTANLTFETDTRVHFSTDKNGIPICKPTSLDWIFDCPSGIRELMLYIKNKYNNPTTYVFENGMADKDNGTLSIEEATKDMARIKYHRGHLWLLQEAIREGANVKGYFPWSFLDDFEWIAGHTSRFGIYYVDYKDGLKRYPKLSAFWFKKFLRK